MIKTTLVAGATGTLGSHVVAELRERGHRVRALGRTPAALQRLGAEEMRVADLTRPETLRGLCDGVDAVISCAGASMALGNLRDRRSFTAVDHRGNRNLLAEAERAGVGRFVHVSLHGAERLLHTEYARAHERFVEALAASPLPHVVVRPTGFFAFFGEILRMAQRGRGAVFGPGDARTNPVHEAEVAEVCVEAREGGAGEISIGGPDVFTRREVVELAFEAIGRPPRIAFVHPGVARLLTGPLRIVNPRLHALVHFGMEVSAIDVVAPARGRRDLRSYFATLAGAGGRA